jgi:hypothetical protein
VARWYKSTYSADSGQQGDCVEVAFVGTAVAVRDSKNPASGALRFSPAAWQAFLSRDTSRGWQGQDPE